MRADEYTVMVEGIRAFFLLAAPVVVAVALAGTLMSALQTAIGVREPALSYAVRLVALIAVLYATLPSAVRSLMTLADLAFR